MELLSLRGADRAVRNHCTAPGFVVLERPRSGYRSMPRHNFPLRVSVRHVFLQGRI